MKRRTFATGLLMAMTGCSSSPSASPGSGQDGGEAHDASLSSDSDAAFGDDEAGADAASRDDASTSSADAGDAGDAEAGSTCCAENTNCSVNSECCSNVCAFTGQGGQCAQKCSTSNDCASGCCNSNGVCDPAAIWCQSTFACWPVGHGCASDTSACCSGTLCADVSLGTEPPALVCATRCSTNDDCASGCCTQFQSGDFLCDRSLACHLRAGTCAMVSSSIGNVGAIGPSDAGSRVPDAATYTLTRFPVASATPGVLTPGLGFITASPDGNLWFTEPVASRIGRITTAGVVTDFATPTPNASPSGIAVGPDGNLWFTERAGLGRITPAGVISEFPIPPDGGAGISPSQLTAGPDGRLWFTSPGDCRVGNMTLQGVFTTYLATCNLAGIAAGADGNLWFPSGGASGSAATISRITPSGVITSFTIPSDNAGYGITAGPDGNVWYAADSKVGRVTPAGVITEYGSNGSQLITQGPNGTLVYSALLGGVGTITTAGVNSLNTYGGELFDKYPSAIALGADGNIWLTDDDNNIYRLSP